MNDRADVGEHTRRVHSEFMRAVEYGGVGPHARRAYRRDMDRAATLDVAAAGGIDAVRDYYRQRPYTGHDTGELLAAMDRCLIAITDDKSVPTAGLDDLPPYRALMLARVAAKAGVSLEHGTVEQMKDLARKVGGSAGPGWWLAALGAGGDGVVWRDRISDNQGRSH